MRLGRNIRATINKTQALDQVFISLSLSLMPISPRYNHQNQNIVKIN